MNPRLVSMVESKPATAAPSLAALKPSPEARRPRLNHIEIGVMALLSALVVGASHAKWWSISATEAWGFATGGICVWLVVREHLWNWPVGLANNVLFFVLFFHSRLYADMGLQLLYFGLGVYGWLNWLHGGSDRGLLSISHTSRREWLAILIGIPSGTWALREILLAVNGAAPFWDSLTTIVSLAAQYLLCRKRLENWLLWILADVIYIPLYVSRGLPLTALLYGVFLTMCLLGIREWKRSLKATKEIA